MGHGMRNLTTNQKLWGMMIVAWISMLLLAALVAAYHLGRHEAKEPTA